MFDQGAYWRDRGADYADEFERHSAATAERFEQQEQEVRAALAALDLEPSSVLEVGCGFGRLTRLLLERFPQASYLGVDISAEQVARARAAHPHLRFEVADFLAADLPRADLLFAGEVLLHFPPEQIAAVVAKAAQLAPTLIHLDPERTRSGHLMRLRRRLRGLPPQWDWAHDYRRLHAPAEVTALPVLGGLQTLFVVRR